MAPGGEKVAAQHPQHSNTANGSTAGVSGSISVGVHASSSAPVAIDNTNVDFNAAEGENQDELGLAFDPVSDNASEISGLDVVDSNWDDDSAIGAGSIRESTASLRSSILDYVEENGRTYHRYKEGSKKFSALSKKSQLIFIDYMLPNDESEQERLDLQHHLWSLTLGGRLHLAPLETMSGGLHNAIDIATGTGIWAIDFAIAYPSAKVIGCDLSPIQPQFVPPNCYFEIDDVEDTWVYSHPFDYVHGRMLLTCFNSHLNVYRSAFEALRPGGYIELHDLSIPFQFADDSGKNSALQRWIDIIQEGAHALGRDWKQAARYREYLTEAGFVDIVEKQFAWPIGTWPKSPKMKRLGAWCLEDVLNGLQAVSLVPLTRGLKWSPEAVELLLVDVRAELAKRKLHAYIPVVVIYAKKPE